jgi:hypothetical protein
MLLGGIPEGPWGAAGKVGPVKVELLYFDGCPGYEAMVPRLRELVGDSAEVKLRRVESPGAAEAERFLGSPTLRIEGEDVERGAAERDDFGGLGFGACPVDVEQASPEAIQGQVRVRRPSFGIWHDVGDGTSARDRNADEHGVAL